jgi:hypothetical protein
MKKLLFYCLLISTYSFSQPKNFNELLYGPWRGIVKQEAQGFGTIATGQYFKIYFYEKEVKNDGKIHNVYGSRTVEFLYEDNFGVKTALAITNFKGTFNVADNTFLLEDYEFTRKDDLSASGLQFTLTKMKMTVFNNSKDPQFIIMQGYYVDDNWNKLTGTSLYLINDPKYNPWKQVKY